MIRNYVRKSSYPKYKEKFYSLLFGHVQILETKCSCIIIKIYESMVSIMQLYNLAKKTPLSLFWQIPPYGLSPFKMKKLQFPSKHFLEP